MKNDPDYTYRLGIMLAANEQQMAERPSLRELRADPELHRFDALAWSSQRLRRQMQEA